jgi:protein SCO1/2
VSAGSYVRVALAAGVLGAALASGAARAQQHGHGHGATDRAQEGRKVPEAALVDQDGRRFDLKELRGRVTLVAFIYTSCHHICPLIYDSVGAVQKRVRSEGMSGVRSVFVTVDPEIDTPEVLKAYAERRGADLATTVFLTESEPVLRAVWEGFGIQVKRQGRGLVDHPPVTFLVDARGFIRYRYIGTMLDVGAVTADLRSVLQATARQP